MFSLLLTPVMMEDAFAAERIPAFMKTNIEWYVTGQITEDEFVNALTHLMNIDVIVLDQARADAIKELRDENKALRDAMQSKIGSMQDKKSQTAEQHAKERDQATMMKSGLSKGSGVATSGAQTAAPFIPGGSVLSAAMSGVGGMQNSAQIVNQITSTTEQLNHLYEQLAMLLEELEQLMADRPVKSDFAKESDYEKTVKAFETQIKNLSNQIQNVQNQIANLQKELEKLQNSDLPNAVAKDQAEMNKRMEEEREAMEQQMGQTSDGKTTSPSDPNIKRIAPVPERSEALSDLPPGSFTMYDQLGESNDSLLGDFDAMLMSYQGLESEIAEIAFEIEENNKVQADLRETITYLRELAANPDTSYPITVRYYDLTGNAVSTTVNNSKEALALAEKLESQLTTMSDSNQQMLFELQQRQQEITQAMQTFSSILKSWHDTAKTMINNLRG